MMPVNHVARVFVAAALGPPKKALSFTKVMSHQRFKFSRYVVILETYRYEVPEVEYAV
jgi:L-aminoadipate-semialdehyde dehydrogenase